MGPQNSPLSSGAGFGYGLEQERERLLSVSPTLHLKKEPQEALRAQQAQLELFWEHLKSSVRGGSTPHARKSGSTAPRDGEKHIPGGFF